VGPYSIFMLSWSISFSEYVQRSYRNLGRNLRSLHSASSTEWTKKWSGILCAMIPTSTVSRLIEIGLRLTGIWPKSSIFFRLLWTLVMGTGLIFQYYYILMHFSVEELPNLIDSLSTALPYSLFFFKLIILWTNNRYVLPTTL